MKKLLNRSLNYLNRNSGVQRNSSFLLINLINRLIYKLLFLQLSKERVLELNSLYLFRKATIEISTVSYKKQFVGTLIRNTIVCAYSLRIYDNRV